MTEKAVVEKPYGYYDTPDGQDIYKKLWCVLKPTVIAATGAGIFDVMFWSHPKGYTASAIRVAAIGLPIIGITSTFVLATNTLASIRQKDDRRNWFFGGFITGSCCGLWAKKPIVGFNMGMLFGILAFLRKEALLQGWGPLVPENPKIRRGGATTCLFDCSLTAERPRNWTTGSE